MACGRPLLCPVHAGCCWEAPDTRFEASQSLWRIGFRDEPVSGASESGDEVAGMMFALRDLWVSIRLPAGV